MIAAVTMMAQTPQSVIDKCVGVLKKGGISARYTINGAQGNMSGTLMMSDKKFRMLSSEVKCWYDGTTMWTWSRATGEVNITNPTSKELAQTNPYSIAQTYRKEYTMSKVTGAAGSYTIKMTPKRKSNIREIYLTINTKSYLITKVQFVQSNNSKTTITVSDYKTGLKPAATTFKFSKSEVPKGTPVVDLR